MSHSYSDPIEIIEVGPRDGFQGEKQWIPTQDKLGIIQKLVDSGLRQIQVASFVHPKLVPQMADAEEVCKGLPKVTGVEFSGLVLNAKGVERALATGLTWLDMGISISDVHSTKNVGKDTEQSWLEMQKMIRLARSHGFKVRAGLQCVFGCAFSGPIAQDRIKLYVDRIVDEDIQMLSLADSTGLGTPALMHEVLGWAKDFCGEVPIALHLHDTWGRGMANLWEAFRVGIRHFDTAFGGLGGCPFIPGASGNVATEDVCALFEGIGFNTGVNIEKVAQVSAELAQFFGKGSSGRVYRILSSKKSQAQQVSVP